MCTWRTEVRGLALAMIILLAPAVLSASAIPYAGSGIETEAAVTADPSAEPGKLRISPEAAIALPQPIKIGAELALPGLSRLRPYGDAGYAWVPFSSGSKSLRVYSLEAGARYFPWEERFFASAALGFRYLGFSTDVSSFKIDDQAVATDGTIATKAFYAGLTLGAEFPLTSKLSFGFDIGLQIPLVAWGSLDLSDSTTGADSSNSELLAVDSNGISRIAKLVLPQITLFRLRWNLD